MNNWVKTIFRHETKQGGAWFSAAVLGKDEAGEKKYEYWPVDFPQGTDIPDRSRVELKDFFISFYTRRDGSIQYKFVVQDFLLQEGPAAYTQQQGQRPQQSWNNGQQYSRQAPDYQRRPQQDQRMDFEAIDESVPF